MPPVAAPLRVRGKAREPGPRPGTENADGCSVVVDGRPRGPAASRPSGVAVRQTPIPDQVDIANVGVAGVVGEVAVLKVDLSWLDAPPFCRRRV